MTNICPKCGGRLARSTYRERGQVVTITFICVKCGYSYSVPPIEATDDRKAA